MVRLVRERLDEPSCLHFFLCFIVQGVHGFVGCGRVGAAFVLRGKAMMILLLALRTSLWSSSATTGSSARATPWGWPGLSWIRPGSGHGCCRWFLLEYLFLPGCFANLSGWMNYPVVEAKYLSKKRKPVQVLRAPLPLARVTADWDPLGNSRTLTACLLIYTKRQWWSVLDEERLDEGHLNRLMKMSDHDDHDRRGDQETELGVILSVRLPCLVKSDERKN